MQEKKDIRKEILDKRLALPKEELYQKSEIICNTFLKLDQYQKSDLIYIYMDFKNEVMTKRIIEDAHQNGKKVAIPKVEGDRIIFYYLENNQKELEEGYFGIREPQIAKPVTNSKGIMVVPGIAFDEYGYRIGYGKGFYDRYLHENDIFQKISLVLELQMVEKVPSDKHDIPVDMIVTEERVINCYNIKNNNFN